MHVEGFGAVHGRMKPSRAAADDVYWKERLERKPHKAKARIVFRMRKRAARHNLHDLTSEMVAPITKISFGIP